MIVLGIDIGTATTGWSVVEKAKNPGKLVVHGYGTIDTKPVDKMADRLHQIYEAIEELIKKYKPNQMAIEDVFYFKNQKTVIKVAQARGVAIVVAKNNNLQVFDYTPLQVKQSVTGYGRAEKSQVQRMVARILKLEEIPKQDDAADALAVAVCHMHTTH